MWYDSFTKKNTTLLTNYLKRQKNKNLILTQIPKITHNKLLKTTLSYTIPYNWNCLITYNLQKKLYLITIYSPLYYLILPIFFSKNTINFDPITNQILIQFHYTNNFTLMYNTILKTFYKSLLQPVFRKIKFKGKGYYIYKNYRNTITPQFGYSHRLYLYAFYINVLFLSKTSLIIFGWNSSHLNLITNTLLDWRPINIFTGRGIRFSKQIIYKKSGKVSSYR